MNDDPRIHHDQMANNAVGWALAAAFAACCWWTLTLPIWIPAIINPLLVVAVAYALARWKRSRFGWLMFWALLAVQAAGVITDLFSGLTGRGPSEMAGAAVLALVVWLVRLPHFHTAAPQVSHVVHHHVLQGHAADLPAGFDVAAIPGTVTQEREAGQLPRTAPRPLPAMVRGAIEAPKAMPRQIGDAIRQAARKRT